MRELSRWLEGLDRAAVLARFDGGRMQKLKIYPEIWTRDDEDLQEELGICLDTLVEYCQSCVASGYGAVIYIS